MYIGINQHNNSGSKRVVGIPLSLITYGYLISNASVISAVILATK